MLCGNGSTPNSSLVLHQRHTIAGNSDSCSHGDIRSVPALKWNGRVDLILDGRDHSDGGLKGREISTERLIITNPMGVVARAFFKTH